MYDIFGVSVKNVVHRHAPFLGGAPWGHRQAQPMLEIVIRGHEAGMTGIAERRVEPYHDPLRFMEDPQSGYVYIYTCIHMYMYITCIYVYNLYICIHELHTLTKRDADRRTLFSKPSQILHGACILTNWKIFLNGPFIRIHRTGRSIPWKREASWNHVKLQAFQILYWSDPKFRRISY